MDVHHILVPVDFSACSRLVVAKAASLARRLGSSLVLLHVAEIPDGLSPDAVVRPEGRPIRAADWALGGARAAIDDFVAEARRHGVDIVVDLRTGAVVDTLLAAADEHHADLIVIGTHGRQGLARAVLGSVAEQVARRAHCPVMLIRREIRPECGRESCDWCERGDRSPAEERLDGEVDG